MVSQKCWPLHSCSTVVVYKVRSNCQISSSISVLPGTGADNIRARVSRLKQGFLCCVIKTQFTKASRVFVADCSRQEAFTAYIAWRQNSMGERAAKKIFCAMGGTGFCGVQEPDFSWSPHQLVIRRSFSPMRYGTRTYN